MGMKISTVTGRIQALARKARPHLTCRWLNRRFTFHSASIFAFCSFALPKVSFQLFHLCPNIHADVSCICIQVLKNRVPVPQWHARIQLLTCQCSCILAYAAIQFAHHIQPISVRTLHLSDLLNLFQHCAYYLELQGTLRFSGG